ncbi:ADP-ribosylglycohydrolase family protein [Sulfuriroseicoccus oceanibius]|uniref:ADP-ribosylglycohydrolase family protein n=1 Tax=Sulfuriroseicoccus oceanibius TaxID=2707525 RepID=A0A6B3LE86_9BACT|nr:ADP-ribosylglycohydrolase family protein [Sulfuriroseicoccus oceanibius]QQL45726.1 ADP-ribosylglycohydrolase family protein [Sulfuriroseicoccus oceanibius]
MNDRMQNAMLGALVADAVSLPVHWYYDTDALDRDYPDLTTYQAPRNPHPDSILWRSHYTPLNEAGDILHEQAKFWGQRGIHYHQFLPAGDSTLNFLLGAQLYRSVVATGQYDPRRWLQIYIDSMRKPGWHNDTYVEEYHRAFFENLARGVPPKRCGIEDIHIGGLTPVPFLLAALDALGELPVAEEVSLVLDHLALTHRGSAVAQAGRVFTKILHAVCAGIELREAVLREANDYVGGRQLRAWESLEDREVVGQKLTPACYLPDSFTASLFLVWKYHDDFSAGVIANARCGGDNAHRGAVVGSLLAARNGVPERWLRELKTMERLRCDTLDTTF